MTSYVGGVSLQVLTALKPRCRPNVKSRAAPADVAMAMTRVGQPGLHAGQPAVQLSSYSCSGRSLAGCSASSLVMLQQSTFCTSAQRACRQPIYTAIDLH